MSGNSPAISKACGKCGVVKPLSGFSKHKTNRDRLETRCRECQSVSSSNYRSSVKAKWSKTRAEFRQSTGLFKCASCLNELPNKAFNFIANCVSGIDSMCRECRMKRDAADRARNIKAVREYHLNYYLSNNEAIVKKKSAYDKTEAGKRARRVANENRKRNHPEKYKAKRIFDSAVKVGKVKRKPCEECGNLKSEGHHEDYSKPLDVIWLCRLHHMVRHGKFKRFTEKETGIND